ncbi:MAG: histidine phosphatase family protein [Acidimicrobiia bacterium]|nr:histidine phosphatase family protein [Acidimicrobiia bacterium]
MSSLSKAIVLVRHGETEWSRTGQHTGRTDVALTATGRRQADQLAGMLDHLVFSRVWSSPLQRAWETSVLAGFGDVAERDGDLVEWDYGVYEGRKTVDIRAAEDPTWTVWTHPIDDGESIDDVGERCDRVIERSLAVDGDVALFAHGHLLRVLTARWLGLAPDAGRLLSLRTATVSVLGFERETRVLARWNDECHLRGVEPLR